MRRLGFGPVVSIVGLAAILASCATGSVQNAASVKGTSAKLGFASRALVALNANDYAAAVGYAEQAAEKSPEDLAVRNLLANAYFGAGRFASAEAAYRDSLRLDDNQPKVILKLILVQIAQGKHSEAMAFLSAARTILDPADYGMALALAGQPAEAIAALEPAARARGADARVRQNLALSHALAGNWDAARIIAAQDVPADQLDQRIQEWMRVASPTRASDQVAMLTGVTPAAVDPGQPVRLALVQPKAAVATAEAKPVPVAPAPAIEQPNVEFAEAIPAYVPPPVAETATMAAAIAAAPALSIDDEPFVEVSRTAPERKAVRHSDQAKPAARADAYVPRKLRVTPAALRTTGKSNAVVQLGAYGSPDRVAAAWNNAARKFGALRGYLPVSARVATPKGTFYRLSVKGFASADQAKTLCMSLRRSGGSCFVRNVAGDAPVQLALR